MSQKLQFISGAVNTTDTASGAVPAGQTYTVTSITYEQPAGSVAKTLNFALNGTSLTAANVRRSISLPAGQSSDEIFPGFVLPTGTTFNYSASTGANECKITVNVSREFN